MVRIYPKRPFNFLEKGTRYLVDSAELEFLKDLFFKEKGKILEIGSGKGHISAILPCNSIFIEKDLKHKIFLCNYPHVIWKDIFDIKPREIDSCNTVVSNLPFDKSISILLHCVKNYFFLKLYYVILQQEVALSILNKNSVLSHKINHIFNVSFVRKIPNSCFEIKPKVNGILLKLEKKEFINWSYLNFLNSIKHPRKTLHNNGLLLCYKRINELTSSELYDLYLKKYENFILPDNRPKKI